MTTEVILPKFAEPRCRSGSKLYVTDIALCAGPALPAARETSDRLPSNVASDLEGIESPPSPRV